MFDKEFPESEYFENHSRLAFEGADRKVKDFIATELTKARERYKAELRERVERQTVYMRSKFLLHAPDCCEPVPKSIGVEEEPLFGMILREHLLTIISE